MHCNWKPCTVIGVPCTAVGAPCTVAGVPCIASGAQFTAAGASCTQVEGSCPAVGAPSLQLSPQGLKLHADVTSLLPICEELRSHTAFCLLRDVSRSDWEHDSFNSQHLPPGPVVLRNGQNGLLHHLGLSGSDFLCPAPRVLCKVGSR